MAKLTNDEISRLLDEAIASKHIWNVDYEGLKSTLAQNIVKTLDPNSGQLEHLKQTLDDEESLAFETWINSLSEDPRLEHPVDFRGISDNFRKSKYYKKDVELLYSITHANPTVLLGYCLKADTKLPKDSRWDVVRDTLNSLRPLLEKWAEVKNYIEKGRKPSLNLSQIPMRTPENTGTCGICERNIKLFKKGNGRFVMWTHGYRQDHHFGRTADCFGTGHEPIELSSEVLSAYKLNLEEYLKNLPGKIENLKKWLSENELTKENRKDYENRRRYLSQMIYERKEIPTTLENLVVAIQNWKPKDLPGAAWEK